MQELAKFKARADADAVAKKLDKENIPLFILSDAPGETEPNDSANLGVKIMVNDGDLEKAKSLLK